MINKEEIAEDLCFICKDGGHLRICDFGDCLKAYHPACLEKDNSFLDSEEKWTCGWHSCSICKKCAKIQCFCCPSAVCFNPKCLQNAEIVQVKAKSRGLCRNCLKLGLLIETKACVDSDGENVDFEDRSTCEFLFKDYWDIIKGSEKFSLEDLQTAKASLESGQFFPEDTDSDKCYSAELPSDLVLKESYDEESALHDEVGKQNSRSKSAKGSQHKKRNFTSWASKELLDFLGSIGKDTIEPCSQLDTSEMIKRYVFDNNLLHPVKKRKKVLCDEKLIALFGKKTVKLFKIHDLLESHFAANEESDHEFDLGFEESLRNGKKNPRINSVTSRKDVENKNHTEPPRSRYASLTKKNIKLVFLRRSLVQDFLKNLDDFEAKMVGSFVRVKYDAKDFFKSPERMYELGQVTSTRKVSEAYRVGEISTNIVLLVSGIWKDVRISMLSEDDFEEGDCEHLQQLVKKGLHPRPLLRELQKKAVDLHKDITIHWINREIPMLQKQIDRANEKGWRRGFHELFERRALLCTPAEQERLLREIPKVEPSDEREDDHLGCQVSNEVQTEDKKEQPTTPAERINTDRKMVTQRNSDSPLNCQERNEEHQETSWVALKKTQSFGVREGISCKKPPEKVQTKPTKMEHDVKAFPVSNMDHNSGQAAETAPRKIEVIDLDEDEGEKDGGSPTTGENNCGGINTHAGEFIDNGWHYLDPKGIAHGPFHLEAMQIWWESGYFDDDFKVWRHGHPQSKAILLQDALRKYR